MSTYILWIAIGILALSALFAVRAWFGYAQTEKDAAEDWDYKVSQNMEYPNLTKDGYISAYKRAYAPRRNLYFAATLAAITVLTPLALALLNAMLYGLNELDKADAKTTKVVVRGLDIGGLTYEPGNLIYGFIAFFGIAGIWAGICAISARIYYRRAPGPLRDEILRERMR